MQQPSAGVAGVHASFSLVLTGVDVVLRLLLLSLLLSSSSSSSAFFLLLFAAALLTAANRSRRCVCVCVRVRVRARARVRVRVRVCVCVVAVRLTMRIVELAPCARPCACTSLRACGVCCGEFFVHVRRVVMDESNCRCTNNSVLRRVGSARDASVLRQMSGWSHACGRCVRVWLGP